MSAVSGNAFSAALWFEHAVGGSRIPEQLLCHAPRTTQQLAAAVRTLAFEHVVGAGRAESAFEGTDVRVSRVSGQVAVTAFAVGSKLQHVTCLLPYTRARLAAALDVVKMFPGTGLHDAHLARRRFETQAMQPVRGLVGDGVALLVILV